MDTQNIEKNADHIVRALALDGQVRLTAIRSTDTVETARKTHDLSPVVTVALGRFMTALQLMSVDLKSDSDEITGIIKSDGPIRGLTGVVKANADVKAFAVNTTVESFYQYPGKFDVSKAIGNGVLTIIKAQAHAKPYSGSVRLISGEIAEDFTYYLASSEQVPSIVGLGVLVDQTGVLHAGGYLVQLMPGATEQCISYLEERIQGFPDLSYLMEEGFSPAQILDLLMGDPEIQYLSEAPSRFSCDCTKDRMVKALSSLPENDLRELMEDENGIDLTCEFCNQDFHFPVDELEKILISR